MAAKRIIFGKFLNVGQTCIAPDYILAQDSIKEMLIEELKKQITSQFGEEPLTNPAYGKIINDKHFQRLKKLLSGEKTIHGGKSDASTQKIEPTLVDLKKTTSSLMKEEIFGPILPIISYEDIDQAKAIIAKNPNPLALYLFTKNNAAKKGHIRNNQFWRRMHQ